MVKVRVHSSLNCYLPAQVREKSFEVSWREAPDLEKLVEILGIPEDAVAIVQVNERTVARSERKNFNLSDGDRVQFFPVISGG